MSERKPWAVGLAAGILGSWLASGGDVAARRCDGAGAVRQTVLRTAELARTNERRLEDEEEESPGDRRRSGRRTPREEEEETLAAGGAVGGPAAVEDARRVART